MRPLPRPSPPPGLPLQELGPVTRAPRVGEVQGVGALPPAPGQGGTWAPRPLAVWVLPLRLQAVLPAPHIQTPAFPQSPLPHQSTKTSPSLGLREKAGRPPGLGRSTQSRLGTEQDALGKETIWSLKELQGADPRPWELAQARHRHLQRTAGRSQRPVSRGPGAHIPPTDNLTPPQHLPLSLPKKPGYRPKTI